MDDNSPQKNGRDPYAALRVPDFRLVSIGAFLATIGTQMQSVAIGWELYERTHSALALGLTGLAEVSPVLLLSLYTGHLVDSLNRKRVVQAAVAAWALVALCLAVISYTHAPVGWVYVCLVMSGIANAFNSPAQWALLPELVPEEILTNAIALNSTRFQIAAMTGPALGGFAIGAFHRAGPVYIIDAVCALALVLCLFGVRSRSVKRPREPMTRKSLAAGLHFVLSTKLILATITMDMFAVLLGGATTLLPIFAKDILHVGATGLGWLRAAPSVGAVLTTLLIAHLPPMRRTGPTLLWAIIGFGVATIVFGLSHSFGLSMLMLFLTGALDSISVFVRATLVQLLTPDSMRGRVSAVNSIFIGTSNELGGFESGLVARFFGPVVSVVAGGIGTILVVLLVAALWPQVAKLGSLETIKPDPETLAAPEQV